MKLIGQILLWIGFLSGSLATVFCTPSAGVNYVKGLSPEVVQEKEMRFELRDLSEVSVPEDGWGLISWPWYLGSVAVAIAGVVMLYRAKSTEGQQSELTKSNLQEIKSSLDKLITNLGSLRGSLDTMPPSQITKYIDDVLADDFRIFADGRDSITAEHDLSTFAEVMTQFAAGERSVNRAWSAAADGYVDEVATCLERAEAMLETAKLELHNASEAK